MKWALLVVDVQKAFLELDPPTTRSLRDAIETINAAIELFREKGLPIVCVQHMDEQGKLVPGEPGFEVPDELKILPADLHISKTYSDAFAKTPLQDELRALGVGGVIVTGFCAEYCVLSTCRGAESLDFAVVILRGALASGAPEHIRFVEDVSDVVSYGALKSLLG